MFIVWVRIIGQKEQSDNKRKSGKVGAGIFKPLRNAQHEFPRQRTGRGAMRHQTGIPKRQGQDFAL